MKVKRNSWLLMPLAIALGIALNRSGYLERAVTSSAFNKVATVAFDAVGVVRAPMARLHHRIADAETIRDYLGSHPVRKLQVGAGGKDPEGWLNSDIDPSSKEVYLDATRRFPLPDESFQYVFSEHMFEHVSWEDGIALLRECYRVLALGGRVRTVTPDLGKFVRLLSGLGPEEEQYIGAKLRFHQWPVTPMPGIYILNREEHKFGHHFLYDSATLRKSLELAGFQHIAEIPMGEETDPVFREAEFRTRNPGSDLGIVNHWEAMAFEATRKCRGAALNEDILSSRSALEIRETSQHMEWSFGSS